MNKQHWNQHTNEEVNFWQSWAQSRGAEWKQDYAYRFDSQCESTGLIQYLLNSELINNDYRILDVGAGPVTTLGKYHRGTKLNITAVDALSNLYDQIKWLDPRPNPLTRYCETERLCEIFEENSFDLVHARNCLDHHYDAVLALTNMIKVTKSGGLIVLIHAENEAINNKWHGLHQWNFYIQDQDLKINNREHTYSVTELIGSSGEIIVNQRNQQTTLETVIRKK